MAADEQIVRLWGLLNLLSQKPEGMTAKQISDRMGQSKSTVVRDIGKLARAGFTIVQQPVKNRRVYMLSGEVSALKDIEVTSLEMLSLYAVRSLTAPLAGTPIYDSLQSLFQKLHGAAQKIGNGRLDIFPHVYLEHTRAAKDYSDAAEVIDTLVDGIVRKRVLSIRYQPPGKEPRTHALRPVKLFFNMGGLYCLGLLGEKKVVSTLAVERVIDADMQKQTFKIPKDLKLKERLEGVFGVIEDHDPQEVVVRFDRPVAPYIRARVWHPKQKLKDLPDGGVEWSCTVQGKEEVLAWILSRGAYAELIKPKAWREELATRVGHLAERYRG